MNNAICGHRAIKERGLRVADEWIPSVPKGAHLFRTILGIKATPVDGERVAYLDRNGDLGYCGGVAFRSWVSTMRCVWRHDPGVAEAIQGDATPPRAPK